MTESRSELSPDHNHSYLHAQMTDRLQALRLNKTQPVSSMEPPVMTPGKQETYRCEHKDGQVGVPDASPTCPPPPRGSHLRPGAPWSFWGVHGRLVERRLRPQLEFCRAELNHKGALPSHYEGRTGERRRSKAPASYSSSSSSHYRASHTTQAEEKLSIHSWRSL